MKRTSSTPHDGRTMVLITGFGPFPSVPVNATMTLVPRLAGTARLLFPGIRFEQAILPTEWDAAPAHLDKLVTRLKPDLVIHFGVSRRARGFEIERRGRNVRALSPDACGAIPNDTRISARGPKLYASRLPVADIVVRLRQRGIAAFQSWNAGTYLCNATLYHALATKRLRNVQTGFVHIPAELTPSGYAAQTTQRARTSPGCPLTWADAEMGGLEILATCLDLPSPSPTAIQRATRSAAQHRTTQQRTTPSSW
jgi:pyroglutamyl-peptidase